MEQYSNCRSGIVDFVIEIGTSLRYSLRLSFGSLANFQATDILNSRSPNALVEKSSLHVSRENESVSRVTIQEGGGECHWALAIVILAEQKTKWNGNVAVATPESS